jgi:hypothetical protein
MHKSLIDMNKKFISIIVNILNENFPKPKPLIIHEKDALVTAQEIQANKLNEFEKEFNRKQEEFTRAMTLPIPEKPVFSDNAIDEPISELDAIIKKTIAERSFEMQQISNSYNTKDVESWIKSSETSIRSEKTRENQNAIESIKIGKSGPNYDSPAKKLTWADNLVEDNENFPQEVPGLKLKITDLDFDPKEMYSRPHANTNTNKNTNLEERLNKLEKKINILFSFFEKLIGEKNKIEFEN